MRLWLRSWCFDLRLWLRSWCFDLRLRLRSWCFDLRLWLRSGCRGLWNRFRNNHRGRHRSRCVLWRCVQRWSRLRNRCCRRLRRDQVRGLRLWQSWRNSCRCGLFLNRWRLLGSHQRIVREALVGGGIGDDEEVLLQDRVGAKGDGARRLRHQPAHARLEPLAILIDQS